MRNITLLIILFNFNITYSQIGFHLNHDVKSRNETKMYKANDTLSELLTIIPNNINFGANAITSDTNFLYVKYLNTDGFVRTEDVEINSLGKKILLDRYIIKQELIDRMNNKFVNLKEPDFINLCDKISINKDKFSNEVTYRTPSGNLGLYLVKIKNSKETVYYISVYVGGSTLNTGEKGAYLLFDNGKKIIRENVEIDVDYGSEGWMYNAFFKLSKENINLLKNNLITDVKLFIYDKEISSDVGKNIQEYMKCLTK